MRIALLTYRGNMYCGGQGIYTAYLAREWQRAGHEVHVIAGPPLPSLDPGIALHEIPNANVFGFPMPEVVRKTPVRRLFDPLTFWELGVSRFGVFPEMQTFGARLLLRWPELMRKHRFDVVFDNQCLSWGLLGLQATGVPVVSVIHHPLHLDREADFAIDPSFVKRVKRTLYFPLFMQQQVAKRLAKIVTVSEASRREIERCFGIPEKDVAGRLQRHRRGTLQADAGPAHRDRPALRRPHGGPQEGHRHAAAGDGAAARARDAEDHRRSHPRSRPGAAADPRSTESSTASCSSGAGSSCPS